MKCHGYHRFYTVHEKIIMILTLKKLSNLLDVQLNNFEIALDRAWLSSVTVCDVPLFLKEVFLSDES